MSTRSSIGGMQRPAKNPRYTGLDQAWRHMVVVLLACTTVLAASTGAEPATAAPAPPLVWAQIGDDIAGSEVGDRAGHDVAMSADGNTVIVGADKSDGSTGSETEIGHARVFDRVGTTWTQRGADIDGESAFDWSGFSVAMSADGNTVAIGAILNGLPNIWAGHVRVFDWNGLTWAQRGADIDGESAGNFSGFSVALSADGDTVGIGATTNQDNGDDAGHVRVFGWNGLAWTQQGTDIDGAAEGDQAGWSLDMSADGVSIVVGSAFNDDAGLRAGHARIFDLNGTAWVQRGTPITGMNAGDNAGTAVGISADGSTVAVGAARYDSDRGQVRVLDWAGGAWTQRGSAFVGDVDGSSAGHALSLSADGNTVAIGADGPIADAGSVTVHDWVGTGWVQRGAALVGEAATDRFGYSVALSQDGNAVVVGAIGHADDRGQARVHRFVPEQPPTPPASVTASAPTPNEAELVWVPGAAVEGFPVSGWQIEQSTDAGASWVVVLADSGDAVPAATLTGLVNGVDVLFRVSGISSAGIGQPTSSGVVTPTAAPSATVSLPAGQEQSTADLPVQFSVQFSESVTGFAAGDVTLTGSAGPSGVTVVSDPFDGSSYTVSVAAASDDGTIEVTVDAGAGTNQNGQPSVVSNRASVLLDSTGPVATVGLAPLQSPSVSATPVTFTVAFDEDVTDFTIADIVVAGTAGPSEITLSGSGADYVVTVARAATAGSITVDVPAAAASDALGNESTTVVTANVVQISDQTPPIVVTPGATVVASTDPGSAFATVFYAVSATDPGSTGHSGTLTFEGVAAEFGEAVPVLCAPVSGSLFPIGLTTVTCTATDAANQTSTETFDVRVVDDEAPIIASPGDQVLSQDAIAAGYEAPDATDNSGEVSVACSPSTEVVSAVGEYDVVCTATDPSGNTSDARFRLTVQAAVPTTGLPATGNGAIPWRHGALLVGCGIALVLAGRRRRTWG